MRAVVTRVAGAEVRIAGAIYSKIESGLLVLLGSQEGDTDQDIRYICEKVCGLRIFEDAEGKMNLSIREVGGEILLVSQFTLLGDARKGKRPSFYPCRCARTGAGDLRSRGTSLLRYRYSDSHGCISGAYAGAVGQ